jgi:TonB family protein
MQLKFREVLGTICALALCGDAAAEWRCDCTSIVGSCAATATVEASFIEVKSNVEQCARVDYFVDGVPFVALVVDGSDRQDWIARSAAPSIIIQSCQICRDNSGVSSEPEFGSGLYSEGEATRLISVAADYPPSAAAAGIEGFVDVRFSISPSGTVVAPEVVAAEPAGVFEAAALAAVARWRYTRPLEAEPLSITERIEFNLADEIFSLSARRGATFDPITSSKPLRNNCVREESRYDFGETIDISLINACEEPLIVYSCSSGTGAWRDRWTCIDQEQRATLLAPARAAAGAAPASAVFADGRQASTVGRFEISRAPNGEYWWLACAVDDVICRDEGSQWVRAMNRQIASIDPQDRTRARLARSY